MKYGSIKYGMRKYGYGDVNFIFDRTIEDIQKNTEKAYINYTDMNRLNKIILIKEHFHGLCYFKQW